MFEDVAQMRKTIATQSEQVAQLITYIGKLEDQLHISGMLPETFKIQDILGKEFILDVKTRTRLTQAKEKEPKEDA